ncbi:hypothetical protein JOQ06_015114 [Pogonophryne albipinna]|uniref:Uncharacterized protein n=1 Tax=Pogonophryne albipinna TaxID=1090488 RepID=A0AAD6AMB2_9TELE|nr:hypothetical protein JOQ06_015114 [Pogonophryne albipinna]
MHRTAAIQDFSAKSSGKQQQHLPEIWDFSAVDCRVSTTISRDNSRASHFLRQGHGTLISPYPLYPSDCPTLTPPRLTVFALALHGTSVTAPATAARSLPSPILPQAC